MSQHTIEPVKSLPLTIGLDLGSDSSQCAIYGTNGERIEERQISTTHGALTTLFELHLGARIVMEASTPTRWINNLAMRLGHEVIIANPRNIPLITANTRKCDRNDARLLGELGQIKPSLLSPVLLRADHYQEVRTLLFARALLVKQRTSLVTFVRCEVKSVGKSLPSCGTKCFAKKSRSLIPTRLTASLHPTLDLIEAVTVAIDQYDKQIEKLSEEKYPETQVIRQVHGVGPLIALAYVVTIGGPERFAKSRTVGAYFGLVPRICQSGKSNPELSITKTGDRYMRTLLVSAATRILGPHGEDSDLRRYGERIIAQGGKRAKGRARIAVARKLAVLLHRLLATGEVYEPLRNSDKSAA